ncbi:MAG TPA: hypothetical protein VK508_06400 [Cyclobacteriaceae bacterium]|nr:hypothetical protein [Cyclobacteriaceae bacterium]
MKRSRKIFLIIAAAFLVIVGMISYDFARKTTFPGPKSPATPEKPAADTTRADSAAAVRR